MKIYRMIWSNLHPLALPPPTNAPTLLLPPITVPRPRKQKKRNDATSSSVTDKLPSNVDRGRRLGWLSFKLTLNSTRARIVVSPLPWSALEKKFLG
jgi:hypothetical protein